MLGKPTYINSATTTVVKVGPGKLFSIIITEVVAGTIIVYDNATGVGNIIASFAVSAPIGTYIFDCVFQLGLTIITAGASKLTVVSE